MNGSTAQWGPLTLLCPFLCRTAAAQALWLFLASVRAEPFVELSLLLGW